jgi:argininosuccinate lyase
MKLWDKGKKTDNFVENFTTGNDPELDLYLASSDVLGSIAHVKMLGKIGLLKRDEVTEIHRELINIYKIIENGDFSIEKGIEDVHSQVEFLLTQKLGEPGKKVHSGRSRNDQVLVDIRLYTRDKLVEVVKQVNKLFGKLQELSDINKDILIPGYTHLQIAMPSSFGLWFGAYAEALVDDLRMILSVYQINNQNPLGSAAGYGSSFPLDRTLTTQLLGFDDLAYNVVYAQMGRGKVERTVAFSLASLASTIGKMAADVCLFMSQNFSFVSLPDQFTTGSSIMPHKKNPDLFEIMRSKCNQVQALPFEIGAITSNLTSGYFRDLQMIKQSYLPIFDYLIEIIEAAHLGISNLIIKKDILENPLYDCIFTVEKVNELVINGVPFREAYKMVGTDVENNTFKPNKQVNHTHEGSIGNLCNDKINNKFKEIFKQFDFAKVEKAKLELLKRV